MKTNIQWIDIVKGITIAVVVLLHINYSGYSETYVYHIKNAIGDAWDMPVFFLIGGFFLTREKLIAPATFLKRKFKTIYAKLLVYYFVFLSLHNTFIQCGLLSTTMEYGGKHMETFSFFSFLSKMLLSACFMGREPYLSPLWFIYVMFMAFIIITTLAYIINIITRSNQRLWHIYMTVILLALCSLSLFCSNYLDINIPRCNNTFSAAWMIYVGYLVRNTLRIDFNKPVWAIIAAIIFALIIMVSNHMAMITNSYSNILQLTLVGLSALYLLAFISQHIQHTIVGNIIAAVGRASYHVMALHLVVINIAAAIINSTLHTHFPIDILGTAVNTIPQLLLFTTIGIVIPTLCHAVILTFFHLCKKKYYSACSSSHCQ